MLVMGFFYLRGCCWLGFCFCVILGLLVCRWFCLFIHCMFYGWSDGLWVMLCWLMRMILVCGFVFRRVVGVVRVMRCFLIGIVVGCVLVSIIFSVRLSVSILGVVRSGCFLIRVFRLLVCLLMVF